MTMCSLPRNAQKADRTIQKFFFTDAVIPVDFEMDTPIDAHVYATANYTYLSSQASASDDTISLYRISNTSNAVDILPVPIPKDSALDKRSTLAGIAVEDSYVCLLFWRALVVYQRMGTDGSLSKPKVIGLRYPYSSLRLFGDTCIISLSKLANREYASTYTYLALIDISNGKFRWERPFPDPDGVQFTYFIPRRPVDFTKEEVAIADIIRYRINIYNHDGQLVTSLVRHPHEWSPIPDTAYQKYMPPTGRVAFNPKPHLDSLRPYVASSSMIRLADFVNDTTLLIAWQSTERYSTGILKGRVKVFFDIWSKTSGEWGLLASDIRDFNPMPSDTFSVLKMMEYSFDYAGVGSNYCYRFRPLPPMDLTDKTFEEIARDADSYMIEHDPKFSLVRFRMHHRH